MIDEKGLFFSGGAGVNELQFFLRNMNLKSKIFSQRFSNILYNVFVCTFRRANTSGGVQYSGLIIIKIQELLFFLCTYFKKSKQKHCMEKVCRLAQ